MQKTVVAPKSKGWFHIVEAFAKENEAKAATTAPTATTAPAAAAVAPTATTPVPIKKLYNAYFV